MFKGEKLLQIYLKKVQYINPHKVLTNNWPPNCAPPFLRASPLARVNEHPHPSTLRLCRPGDSPAVDTCTPTLAEGQGLKRRVSTSITN